jgi:drug/metabolite transporter (DMT)-like permease
VSTAALFAGIGAALGSGAGFGSSAFLQYRATHEVRNEPAGSPRLLVDLWRLRRWRWSILLAATAFGLQAMALRFAPLAVVQPLLVTGVLWYVTLTAAIMNRRFDRTLIAAIVVCLAGLSAFLISASPETAAGGGSALATGLTVGMLAVIAVFAVLASTIVEPRWRALPLAFASGVCYGATAGLLRGLFVHVGDRIGEVGQQWETYAICVVGPLGVLLNQNAYQSGRAGASALTVITVVDPLVAIVLGIVWLGESLRTGPWHLAVDVAALLALIAGVAVVASRSPRATVQAAGSADPRVSSPGSDEG